MRAFASGAAIIQALAAAPLAQTTGGRSSVELPLLTQKFSDKVLFAWVGDYMQTIRVVALSTARGVVVIEANLSRSADVRIRQAIEKEFGRKDFKYLINTHFHHDHVCGNQVYADATVVGHRTVPEGMKGELTGEGLVKLLEMFNAHIQDWGERQRKAAPDSRDYHFFREGVILGKTTVAELEGLFAPLMVIWVGYGLLSKISIAFLVAFFPIVVNTVVGLKEVEPELLELARINRGSAWDVFAKIRLPNSLPHMFAGIKVAIVLSVTGAIVAEFVAANEGLGYLVLQANYSLDTAFALVILLILAVLSLGLFWLAEFCQRKLAPWSAAVREVEGSF